MNGGLGEYSFHLRSLLLIEVNFVDLLIKIRKTQPNCYKTYALLTFWVLIPVPFICVFVQSDIGTVLKWIAALRSEK